MVPPDTSRDGRNARPGSPGGQVTLWAGHAPRAGADPPILALCHHLSSSQCWLSAVQGWCLPSQLCSDPLETPEHLAAVSGSLLTLRGISTPGPTPQVAGMGWSVILHPRGLCRTLGQDMWPSATDICGKLREGCPLSRAGHRDPKLCSIQRRQKPPSPCRPTCPSA